MQQVEVAFRPVTEAKVVAHQQVTHSQARHQVIPDEVIGRNAGKRPVEPQHQNLIQRGLIQSQHLFLEARQSRRRPVAGKKLPWLGLEGHHRRGELLPGADFRQLIENGPVAEMHAVEITDGQRAVAVTRTQVV